MNSPSFYNYKKIIPVEHPDLVLKSPIAYHRGTDLSVIPINKDGIAVCLNCGAIGVKHAFYTKQRSFCSLTCVRTYTGVINPGKHYNMSQMDNKTDDEIYNYKKKNINYRFKIMDNTEHLVGMIPMEPFPQLPGMLQPVIDKLLEPIAHKSSNSYDWTNELTGSDFTAAPVELFRHAPSSSTWNTDMCSTKVEIKNRDCKGNGLDGYDWVGTILKLKGYMGLVRYEGFGNDESQDFWINLMHPDVHPVGWGALRGKPLNPPDSIKNKHSDWKSFLVLQLTCAKTLPVDFYEKFYGNLKSRFRLNHIIEVVNKERLSEVKVAKVVEIVGKRLHVKYFDSLADDIGFWCHEDCPLIHPVGWARKVGHLISASSDYLERLDQNISHPDDTTANMFKYYTQKDPHNIGFDPVFVEGMKLEAIDPLNLSSICVATVMKVLFHGYLMLRIDCYPSDDRGPDWFCYHKYSPCIFPIGFCNERNIPVTVSPGQVPPPTNIISSYDNTTHGFKVGMRLECTDLMESRLICVATVASVIGRLLKIHFNGWGDEYDQWLDCESMDIYPVGWCQAVGHKLEGPKLASFIKPPSQVQPKKKGRKRKNNNKISNEQPKIPQRAPVVAYEVKNIENSYEPPDDLRSEENNFQCRNDSKNEAEQSLESQLKNLTELENHMDWPETNAFMDSLDFNTENTENKEESSKTEEIREKNVIPRLVGTTINMKMMESITPEAWDTEDVSEFLMINDCAPYCSNFCHITGKTMLDLTKDEIIELLQMKVGPSLKIYDLIQQLKCKLKPVHGRNKIFK